MKKLSSILIIVALIIACSKGNTTLVGYLHYEIGKSVQKDNVIFKDMDGKLMVLKLNETINLEDLKQFHKKKIKITGKFIPKKNENWENYFTISKLPEVISSDAINEKLYHSKIQLISSGKGKSKVRNSNSLKIKKPNIVLIIIDTLRSDKLGCYGFKDNISPEIDAIAKQGVLFENVYSQSSWTRPSIGSLITSLYPRSIGIFKEKFDILADRFITLAEILKENGYITIGFTANPNINSVFNFDQGFDFYSDSNAVWDWMKPKPDQFKAYSKGTINLPRAQELFNYAIKKATKNSANPVYIQITIMEVHSPELVRDEYKNLFNQYKKIQQNQFYPYKKLLKRVNEYYAAIRQVSYDVGEFISKLQSIPGFENTLFIITSDHGEGLDDHPNVDRSTKHGNLLYKSVIKVPLIFYSKEMLKFNKFQSQVINLPVRLLDIMPTILDYAKVSTPGNIQGNSLLEFLHGKSIEPNEPEHFFVETSWRTINKLGVYYGKWEYFQNRDKLKGLDPAELQLITDFENGSKTNRIFDFPEVAKKMKIILKNWLENFPKSKRINPNEKISKKEIEQLKTLGYIN